MLSAFSLRRVLLAGEDGCMLRTMQTQLSALGARPVHLPGFCRAETMACALRKGRYACAIAPDLSLLGTGAAQSRLAALDTLLFEAREAGVPLVMLLSVMQAEDSAQLFSHALRFSFGACGDPLSVQCIRHTGESAEAVSREALRLGVRFLTGERSCVGMFSISGRNGALGLPPQSPKRDFAP